MADEIPDLWPDDISPDSTSPVAVLRRQAGQLAHRTRGLVEAELRTRKDVKEKRLVHEFMVIARPLNYTTLLFLAWHDEELVYPVYINFKPWDDKARREWEKTQPPQSASYGAAIAIRSVAVALATGREEPPSGNKKASSQEELIDLLREILTSSYSKSIITSLVARTNDATADSESLESGASETAESAT